MTALLKDAFVITKWLCIEKIAEVSFNLAPGIKFDPLG
jgi:hypothetical protein